MEGIFLFKAGIGQYYPRGALGQLYFLLSHGLVPNCQTYRIRYLQMWSSGNGSPYAALVALTSFFLLFLGELYSALAARRGNIFFISCVTNRHTHVPENKGGPMLHPMLHVSYHTCCVRLLLLCTSSTAVFLFRRTSCCTAVLLYAWYCLLKSCDQLSIYGSWSDCAEFGLFQPSVQQYEYSLFAVYYP